MEVHIYVICVFQTSFEPEIEAVMDWLKEYKFVLSANIHGGAVVVNYPFDENSPTGENSPPDEKMFELLAHSYANVSISHLLLRFSVRILFQFTCVLTGAPDDEY